jgi:hypothetical protein
LKKRNSRNDPAAIALRSAASAMKAGETLGAAAAVIAARTEMATLAIANPNAENDAEMSLMVSEKLEAFTESGAALAKGAQTMASRGARYAAEEAAAAGRGIADLAACKSPAELMLTQSRLMTNFLTRSIAYGFGLNALAARTGERAMGPIHKTVTANHKRLKK